MTNEQLFLAISVPVVLNGFATLLVYWAVSKRIDSLEMRVNDRFDAINQRFDDMRDLWRAELRRVEEVFDARLKILEERMH